MDKKNPNNTPKIPTKPPQKPIQNPTKDSPTKIRNDQPLRKGPGSGGTGKGPGTGGTGKK